MSRRIRIVTFHLHHHHGATECVFVFLVPEVVPESQNQFLVHWLALHELYGNKSTTFLMF